MNAVDLLIDQHRELEARMKETKEAQEPAAIARLLAQVGDQLTTHIASEEQLFYPAVNAKRTEDILLESLEEHLSLKRLLADLLEMQPDEKTFEPKFKVLTEQAVHHHKEEEEDLFPKARKLLDSSQLDELGTQMMALQQSMQLAGRPRDNVAGDTDKAASLG